MTVQPCIEFSNVSKSYGMIRALEGLSLEIAKGEIFGYIGPNGAGKTTTIRILVGLIQKYDGSVKINGQDIKENPQTLYSSLGYLPQEVGFQEWRTVEMALMTFGRLSGMTSEAAKTRIPEVLNQVGLPDVEERKIKTLSGGMRQKLRIAQALLHKPEILVMDEPMSGLDPASRFQIKAIIESLAKEKITILLSSHILSDIEVITSRVGILHYGKLLKVGVWEKIQNEFSNVNELELKFSPSFKEYIDFEKNVHTIPGIISSRRYKPKTMILTVDSDTHPDQGMQNTMEFLLNKKYAVEYIKQRKPNLEDVYMQLVGAGGESQ